MRVYTFTLPKFVSSIVRKCMVVFQQDEKAKSSKKKKRKKKDKMPS